MDLDLLTQELYQTVVAVAVLSGPPLVIASLIGLFVAILQAVTQIQDQSFPQIIKLIAVGFSLMAFGGALSVPLIQQTQDLFSRFYLIVR
jgi:type III secretion protein S